MAAILKKGGSKKDEYKSIHSEEEHSLIPKLDDNASSNSATKKKRKKKKRKKVSFWTLIANCNFLFFFVNCLTPFGIAILWFMMQPDTSIAYIASGILGITVSLYGYRRFSQLMALIHQTNRYQKNNAEFRAERSKLRAEVQRIKAANKELKETEKRLSTAIGQNRENLQNFKNVQGMMKSMNVKDFQSVASRAGVIGQRWREELIAQERNMLNIVFGRYEMTHDGVLGMTKPMFGEFSEQLPVAYKERFARLGTFEKLSNDKGILVYEDFEMVLDVFAQMVVDDVDIEVEIVKEELTVPGTGLHSPMHSNMISMDSPYGDDYDDDDEEDEEDGRSFLQRLKSWRVHRAETSMNVSRTLKIKGSTPVGGAESGTFESFNMFAMLGVGGKKKKKKQDEKHASDNLLSPVVSQPKPIKTMSALDGLDEHEVDDEEIDDEAINMYMRQTLRENPLDADSPIVAGGSGGGDDDAL